MQKSFQAWNIDLNSFPKEGFFEEKIRWILQFAVLAPSGHNTQPWKFRAVSDGVEVMIDQSRMLSKSDLKNRQTLMGIGCCIGNILVAAEACGFEAQASYFPDSLRSDLAASIRLIKKEGVSFQPSFLQLMLDRRTNRSPYREDIIPSQRQIDKLISYIPQSVGNVFLISQDPKLSEIKHIMLDSMREALQSKDFRSELSEWVISNVSRRYDGMPGFTLGIPTPPSLLIPWFLRHTNPTKMMMKENEKFISKTPYIGIIVVQDDAPKTWIRVGEHFERVWLQATKLGIAIHPWNAPVEIGEWPKKIQNLVGTTLRPIMIWRMGYPTKVMNHSPRRTIDEVVDG